MKNNWKEKIETPLQEEKAENVYSKSQMLPPGNTLGQKNTSLKTKGGQRTSNKGVGVRATNSHRYFPCVVFRRRGLYGVGKKIRPDPAKTDPKCFSFSTRLEVFVGLILAKKPQPKQGKRRSVSHLGEKRGGGKIVSQKKKENREHLFYKSRRFTPSTTCPSQHACRKLFSEEYKAQRGEKVNLPKKDGKQKNQLFDISEKALAHRLQHKLREKQKPQPPRVKPIGEKGREGERPTPKSDVPSSRRVARTRSIGCNQLDCHLVDLEPIQRQKKKKFEKGKEKGTRGMITGSPPD